MEMNKGETLTGSGGIWREAAWVLSVIAGTAQGRQRHELTADFKTTTYMYLTEVQRPIT